MSSSKPNLVRPAAVSKKMTGIPAAKAGAQRTTKSTSKLKLLPPEDFITSITADDQDQDVYSQIGQISGDTARRDAEKLSKIHRDKLPRVTAYCTAASYQMDQLLKFLQARKMTHGTTPRRFDECIYSPYYFDYNLSSDNREKQNKISPKFYMKEEDMKNNDVSNSTDPLLANVGSLSVSDSHDIQPVSRQNIDQTALDLFEGAEMSEIFCFEYGVVVLWGFTKDEETQFLRELTKFEVERLDPDDIEVEDFNYYVTDLYQPRIWNDFITLKDGRNYFVKLSISFAIAQSVKISLFEELVDDTIEVMKDVPQMIAETGKVQMSRKKIMMSVGELFILRININLQASVLDNPELMWSEPQLEPVYKAARSYLEINQRVALLNQRVEVIGDLLGMLKEQMAHSHGEYLEWIVVLLIGAEIIIACINIVVDIYAGES